MTTKIHFAGTNSIFEELRGKTFDATITCCGGTMHEIFVAETNTKYLFDIKDFSIHNHIQLQGYLQQGENLGKAAIDIIK